jgi:hypothetical protein
MTVLLYALICYLVVRYENISARVDAAIWTYEYFPLLFNGRHCRLLFAETAPSYSYRTYTEIEKKVLALHMDVYILIKDVYVLHKGVYKQGRLYTTGSVPHN